MMNLKDRIIRKLLDAGKKHRILVYPTLALIAIISAVSHAIYWGKGNGKKLVASAMVMVMLITQSLFLTSSAGNGADAVDNIATGDASRESIVNEADTQHKTETSNETDSSDEMGEYYENLNLYADLDDAAEETNINVDGTSNEMGDGETDNGNAAGDTLNGDGADSGDTVTAGQGEIKVNIHRVSSLGATTRMDTYIVKEVGSGSGFYTLPWLSDLELANLTYGSSDESIAQFSGLCYNDITCKTPYEAGTIIKEEDLSENRTVNLYYTAKRLKYKLLITVPGEAGTSGDKQVDTGITLTASGDPLQIKYTVGNVDTYKLYRRGYRLSGLRLGTKQFKLGQDVIFTPDTDFDYVNMTAEWEPMMINLQCDAMPDGKTPDVVKLADGTQKVKPLKATKFDASVTLPDDTWMPGWAWNEAYYVKAWADKNGKEYKPGSTVAVGSLYEDLGDIEDNPNVQGQTLYAVWEYKNWKLHGTGSNEQHVTDAGIEIRGNYGDEINCTVTAQYLVDGMDGTKFSYAISQSDMEAIGKYGLGIRAETDNDDVVRSYTITGTLKDTTPEGGVSATLTVTDGNKTTDNVSTRTITILSGKRKVSIDPSTIKSGSGNDAPSKLYDGTTSMLINPTVGVTNAIGADNISVSVNSTAVLDDVNAGQGKAVTLEGVTLVGNEDALRKYELAAPEDPSGKYRYENIAEVTRRPLDVTVQLGSTETDNAVLFGENRPEYAMRITDPSKLITTDQTKYAACANDAQYEAFIKNILGFKGWVTTRTIYSPIGEYQIYPDFDVTNCNYSLNNHPSTTFTVSRDTATKDVNYKFSTEMSSNGFYPGLTITAKEPYDKIRLLAVGEGDIPQTATKAEVTGLFGNAVVLPDMVNGTVSFQMMNSSSGAITTIATITGLNVDTSGPVYVGHQVSPNIVFFNEFHFGSYYHSQEVNGSVVESVTLTVEYTTEGSDCGELHYYFANEDGSPKGDTLRSITMVKNPLGNYQAYITIGTGTSGQLIVYATDTTGNPSKKTKIQLQDIQEFDDVQQNANNYYEWMVENTIEAATIVATDGTGKTAVPSDSIWYNNLDFTAAAKDDESGLNKIDWVVETPNDPISLTENVDAKIGNATAYGKVLSYNFRTSLSQKDDSLVPGAYAVSATLYDNAGNSVKLNRLGDFLFDNIPPVITDTTDDADGNFLAGRTFTFTVSEGENESQVASVRIYQITPDGNVELRVWGAQESYSVDIKSNGKYKVVAMDYAGNAGEYEVDFGGISTENPTDPAILVDGHEGSNGWYIEYEPYVTISSSLETPNDKIPVTTNYGIKAGNKETERTFTTREHEFQLTDEGIIVLTAYAMSGSNCKSNEITSIVKVDLGNPSITMDEAVADADGNAIINFRISDDVSGVDPNNITLNGTKMDVSIDDLGVVTGSFKAVSGSHYTLEAGDMAGNIGTLEFDPLDMYVTPIANISSTGADLSAKIYVGTYDLSEYYIQYRRAGTQYYENCPANRHTEEYGMSLDYKFTGLAPNTVYDYRVYAVTKVSKEMKVVEGSFKTGDGKSTGTVYGTVDYADGVSDEQRTEPIYVALYEGNIHIAGKLMDEVGEFNFTNIADGNYIVSATDGAFTQTKAVTIENGGVTYPSDYLSNGGINFILSGLSTYVILEDSAVRLTADQLDSIFDRNYTAVISEEDWAVYDAGGNIDITVYAGYLNVSDISATIQGVFEDRLGANSEIVRYIELNVVKTVTDENGVCVNNTPVNVTRLVKPITIVFPLGDLAGQNISVASLHQNGNTSDFRNWTNGSGATLSRNYVTITTDRFSIYALYKTNAVARKYKVTWKDGDGNTMKTESVEEGKSATPPTLTPRKTETSKYTYTFSSWDVDYKNITKDTIISARFTAHRKQGTSTEEPGTTEKPGTTEQPGTTENPGTTEQPGATENPPKVEPTDPQYPYLGSSQSPNTGDEAPIAVLGFIMTVSLAGAVVIIKKKKIH
ncbi:MAG: YDG domain-containing protein [Clostridium sp.]|nr:YDG domain-containing protein [Clostridium sp.]MCM1399465.1 YDG domain-containing protein [Clostridium sp.]MCM1460019.1 YDG domain-containing protein [Bacteroides sp.]